MILLIAESKTMLSVENDVKPEQLSDAQPCFEEIATEIMGGLRNLSVSELSSLLKLSPSLAAKMQKMIYDFPYKSTGNIAIEAFTGVVFKSLDFPTLSEEAKNRCKKEVRIISSLYGWLKPQDIIKQYRLDFTTKLDEGPSGGKPLNTFWRLNTTKALVKMIHETQENQIINLLPADASKCIDWKLVKRFAKVWKVDFHEINEGQSMKTPRAEKLKSLRGSLLRQILTEGINQPDDLLHVASDLYVCEGTPVYPDHFSFLC